MRRAYWIYNISSSVRTLSSAAKLMLVFSVSSEELLKGINGYPSFYNSRGILIEMHHPFHFNVEIFGLAFGFGNANKCALFFASRCR